MTFGLESFLYVVFLAAVSINISFWIFLYAQLICYRSASNSYREDVTILVVFKNASRYVQSCISSLISQHHVHSILLVNDFSYDDSPKIIETQQSAKLTLYHATNDIPGKKSALQEGISQVNTEVVLLSDVDCQPASDSWAMEMLSHFDDDIDIVLGYSPVSPESGFLNRFIRFETWMTAVQYMSYAIAKIPYMGVGRNLAYRTSIAHDFKHDLSVLSGDDDLFVSAKANANNTRVCLNPKAFVFTEAKSTFLDYYKQKRRHMTTSHQYKWIHKCSLTLFSVSQMLVLPLVVFLICMTGLSIKLLTVLGIYILVKWIIAYPLLRRFEEGSLFFLFPILDICFSLYLWIMSITIFTPKKTWN